MTAIRTGISTKAALARARKLLRSEALNNGRSWDGNDRAICEDRLLLGINERVVACIGLLTPGREGAPLAPGFRVRADSVIARIAEDFETYWAIGNVGQPETAESRHPSGEPARVEPLTAETNVGNRTADRLETVSITWDTEDAQNILRHAPGSTEGGGAAIFAIKSIFRIIATLRDNGSFDDIMDVAHAQVSAMVLAQFEREHPLAYTLFPDLDFVSGSST